MVFFLEICFIFYKSHQLCYVSQSNLIFWKCLSIEFIYSFIEKKNKTENYYLNWTLFLFPPFFFLQIFDSTQVYTSKSLCYFFFSTRYILIHQRQSNTTRFSFQFHKNRLWRKNKNKKQKISLDRDSLQTNKSFISFQKKFYGPFFVQCCFQMWICSQTRTLSNKKIVFYRASWILKVKTLDETNTIVVRLKQCDVAKRKDKKKSIMAAHKRTYMWVYMCMSIFGHFSEVAFTRSAFRQSR